MRINGAWHPCHDDTTRPIILGEVATGTGTWQPVRFLVDTGADCSAFCADSLAMLQLELETVATQLSGIGGSTSAVAVEPRIRLTTVDDRKIVFKSRFAGCTDPNALDMSVLGRDITNLFALIVDRPGDVVCLLSQQHRYLI